MRFVANLTWNWFPFFPKSHLCMKSNFLVFLFIMSTTIVGTLRHNRKFHELNYSSHMETFTMRSEVASQSVA